MGSDMQIRLGNTIRRFFDLAITLKTDKEITNEQMKKVFKEKGINYTTIMNTLRKNNLVITKRSHFTTGRIVSFEFTKFGKEKLNEYMLKKNIEPFN